MSRNLAADSIQVILIYLFECLRHAPVQEALAHAAEGSIRLFAELVVAKVIGLSTQFAHYAPLPQFIQSTY